MVVLISSREAESFGPRLHDAAALGFLSKRDLTGDDWPASLPERRRRVTCIVAVLAIVVGVVLRGVAYGRSDSWLRITDFVVGLVFIGCAVVAARRPDTASLLAATGVAWFVANFDDRLVYLHRGFVVRAMVRVHRVACRRRDRASCSHRRICSRGRHRFVEHSVVRCPALVRSRWACSSSRAAARWTCCLPGERKTALVAAVVFSSAVVANAILRAVAHDHSASTPMLVLNEVALCAVAMLLAAGVVAAEGQRCDGI